MESSPKSFPRGGAAILSELETRNIQEEIEIDFKAPAYERLENVEKLTFKKLAVGMTLLCTVKQVNDLDLVLSLPNLLTGYASITDLNSYLTSVLTDDDVPDLATLFHVGQIIPCCITNLIDAREKGAHRKIELSINPAVVNASARTSDISSGMLILGSVSSVEDHGYIIDLGLKGCNGFLLNKNAKKYCEKLNIESLSQGQNIFAHVLSFKDGKIVSLSLDPELIEKNPIPSSNILKFENIKPGFMFIGKVKQVSDQGLIVSLQDLFTASIDSFHLNYLDYSSYSIDQKVKFRVIYIDANRKRIGATLNSHIINFTIPESNLDVGSKLTMKVTRIDNEKGLVLACDNVIGYAHKSRIMDKQFTKFDKTYKESTTHEARIIAMNPFDGIVSVSLQPSVLKQQFMRYQDLTVGMKLSATISRIGNNGIVVSVSETVSGFIPKIHMSDVVLSDPTKLFKIGSTIKCIVLSCDHDSKRLVLTHKKSLINSTIEKLSSVDDVVIGKVYQGVINSITQHGCFISFFNNITGFVHISELTDVFIKHPSDLYRVGQTVKCRVLVVSDEKLKLSLKIGKNLNSTPSVVIGQIVSGTILSKTTNAFIVELEKSVNATLLFTHLTDIRDSAHCLKLGSSLRDGMKLEECVVVDVDTSGQIFISRKPVLVEFAKKNAPLKNVADLHVSMIIPGYVKKILENGCIVGYVGEIRGFARIHSISDRFVSNISEHLILGQTIISTVMEIDQEAGKFSVSLKNSLNYPVNQADGYETDYLKSLFKESDSIFLEKKNAKVPEITGNDLKIGGSVSGTIKQILPYGALVSLDEKVQVTGLITSHHMKSGLSVGDRVSARVLDIDMEKKIVDLNLQAEIKEFKVLKLKSVQKSQKLVEAQVQIIKQDYLILTIPSMDDVVCFAPVNTFNTNDSPFSKYKEDQRIKVIITHVPESSESSKFLGISCQKIIVVPRSDPSTGKKNDTKLDLRRLLQDPIEKSISCLDDIVLGLTLQVKIKSIKSTQINVEIASNLYGRIHISEYVDSVEELSDSLNPFGMHKIGDILKVKVVGFHDMKTHTHLAITQKSSPSSLVVDLTLRSSDLKLPNFELKSCDSRHPTFESVAVGDIYNSYIQSVNQDSIWVYISPTLLGRSFILECSNSVAILKNLEDNFKCGQMIKCKVISKNEEKKLVDLTFRLDSDLEVGKIVPGIVSNVRLDATSLVVQVSSRMYGRVHLTDSADKFKTNPFAEYNKGDLISCFVLSLDHRNNELDLSLRESKLSSTSKSVFPEINSIEDLSENMMVQGFVKNVSDSGCFVSLNRKLTARVKISELSDSFIKDWKPLFYKGMCVVGKIINVDAETFKIELSLKKSNSIESKTFSNLEIGEKLSGVVSKVERYGIFIKLSNSNISGLCHYSEVDDGKISAFSAGDLVKVIVLDIDAQKKRVSLGLKASYFEDEDMEEIQNESDAEMNDLAPETVEMEIDSDIEEVDNSRVDIDQLLKNAKPINMDSDEESEKAQSSESEEEQIQEPPRKKSRIEKEIEKNAAEKALVEKENLIASGDAAPETADDYERLIVGSPNSSFLWIKYMAFQFQAVDIAMSRKVAERALKTISFRDEKEKMNVWVAYLNLEHSYGTPDSLKEIFDRAVLGNEPKAIYLHLSNIYIRTEQKELVESLFEVMLKKFKQSSKIWTSAGLYYLKSGQVLEARKISERCLKSLPKHKHIKTISKFAQAEYKHGEPERGRTIFEGIMSNFPKKIDIWNVYLDMEIGTADQANIRRLFERVISMKMSSKKMKFFFKKYLEYEKKFGNEKGVEHVKAQATAYVERM